MKDELKGILARRQQIPIFDPTRISAAVLVPLYCKDGQYHLLFTKRTEKVSTHKGQISFPGGVCEKSDCDLMQTALREAHEEIGLREQDVEVLGPLDDFKSITTNFVISPFVGFVTMPYQFTICEDEIAKIIEAPVAALMDKKIFHQEEQAIDGTPMPTYFYDFKGNVIWGATARILHQFLEIVAGLPLQCKSSTSSFNGPECIPSR